MEKKIGISVVTERDIRYKEIEDTEYAVYEDKRTLTGGKEEKIEIIRGLASIEEIESVSGLESISSEVKVPGLAKEIAKLRLIKEEDLIIIRSGEKNLADVMRNVSYEELITEDLEIPEGFRAVLWDHRSYQILDTNKQFIAIPIPFDSLYGRVHNKNYDLEKLMERLKELPGVCNKEALKITGVPSYHREKGVTRMVAFKFLLDDETYGKLFSEWHLFFTNARDYILQEIIKAEDICKKG